VSGGGDDRDDRIAKLEADRVRSDARFAQQDARALEYEDHIAELDARALLRDEKIVALTREVEQLHTKAEFAAVIEQAKGVIMSTMHCGPDAAFAVLVAQSQRENRKLREIAAELAAMQHRS
jgi:AmiR/NasT family two-component response regulator